MSATDPKRTSDRRNAALRLTLTLFDVRPAAESVCAESTPAYGPFGAGNLEAARAVSVPGDLTSKRCIRAPDDKEIQTNDVQWFSSRPCLDRTGHGDCRGAVLCCCGASEGRRSALD